MSELKKELEQELEHDKDFVEEVSNRIYSDTDDIDEYMPKPEWIDQMTDIADKYITRFELAQKLADKHLSSRHLQLDDNQKIVLEWLKDYLVDDCDFRNTLKQMYSLQINGIAYKKENLAFMKLTERELAQVVRVFSTWFLEQEEKHD